MSEIVLAAPVLRAREGGGIRLREGGGNRLLTDGQAIASEEALGAPQVTAGLVLVAIQSAEALGLPTVAVEGTEEPPPPSFGSSSGGDYYVRPTLHRLAVQGIASGERLGRPRVLAWIAVQALLTPRPRRTREQRDRELMEMEAFA